MVVGPGSEFTIAARPALTFRSVVIPRQVSIECSVIIFCFHKELPVFVIALPLRAAKYVIIVQDAGRDAKTPYWDWHYCFRERPGPYLWTRRWNVIHCTHLDNKMPSFPIILHRLLQDMENAAETKDIISWSPDGKSFTIHQPKLFVEQIMRRYFRHQTHYKSFQVRTQSPCESRKMQRSYCIRLIRVSFSIV